MHAGTFYIELHFMIILWQGKYFNIDRSSSCIDTRHTDDDKPVTDGDDKPATGGDVKPVTGGDDKPATGGGGEGGGGDDKPATAG